MPPDLEAAAQRVYDGDKDAFGLLVEQTEARLFRLAARLLGDTGEAEDVLQESYIRAYESLAAGRFDRRAPVQLWLYRVVTNGALDALRSRRRRAAHTGVEPDRERSHDPAQHLDARFALSELNDWLNELAPDQRAALVLKELEGLSAAETGRILGISEGAVELRLVRARAALRKRRQATEEEKS